MANSFDFGIGIRASDEGASTAIQGVIAQVKELENSMTSLAGGTTLGDVMGFDLGSLIPAAEAVDQLAITLDDMSQTLRMISEDTGRMSGAFGGASPAIEDAADAADRFGMEICGVVVCAEHVDAALLEAARSASKLEEALVKVPEKAATVAEHFSRVGEGADMLTASGSKLRQTMTRVYRGMGETAESADLTAASVLQLATDTKTSWEQVSALQSHLAGAAIGMDDLEGSAAENMKTMVMLNESFELTQAEIQSLAGSMKMTGSSLVELAGIGVQFQKDFKVPGLINTLPVAAKAAIEAQSQFGSVVGKSSRDITVNIMRMTGVYSRSLGITAAEAANKARGTFMKFTGEIESYEDLFLGLSDSFTPLQTAFLETGISMEDMEDLMRKGAEAPEEFAEEVKRIRDSLDPQMGERFFRQVLRNTDEATRLLLTQEVAAKNANKAAAGAGVEPEDPSGTFMAIADAMRENAVDANRMHEALTGVASELAALATDEGVRRGLEMVNDVLQVVNTALIEQYEDVRQDAAIFETYTSAIALATAALVGLNDAQSAFHKIVGAGAKALLGGVAGISLLLKPISMLWTAIGGGGTVMGRSGGAFKIFGKTLGKLILPVAIAVAAFDNVVEAAQNIGTILSDPRTTGGEKFKAIVGEMLGAVWGTFDNFFLGLPQKFIDGWNGLRGRLRTDEAFDLGKVIGESIGTVAKVIADIDIAIYDTITGLPARISTFFSNLTWEDVVNATYSLVEAFAAMGDQILAVFEGIGKGFLEAVVGPFEEAELMAQIEVARSLDQDAAIPALQRQLDVLREQRLQMEQMAALSPELARAAQTAIRREESERGMVAILQNQIKEAERLRYVGREEEATDLLERLEEPLRRLRESGVAARQLQNEIVATVGAKAVAEGQFSRVTAPISTMGGFRERELSAIDMESSEIKTGIMWDRRRREHIERADRNRQMAQFARDERMGLAMEAATEAWERDMASDEGRAEIEQVYFRESTRERSPQPPVAASPVTESLLPGVVASHAGGAESAPAGATAVVTATVATAPYPKITANFVMSPGVNGAVGALFEFLNIEWADQGTSGF